MPSIAIGTDGSIHAAFKQGSTVNLEVNDAVYTSSSDGGTTWSALQTIYQTSDTFVVDKVEIAVDASGVVHAAWVERDPNAQTYELFYASRSNNAWSNPQSLDTSFIFTIRQPSLIEAGGQIYLAWVSGADDKIRFATRTSAGWSSLVEVDDGPSQLPELALDDQGNVHIAFLKSTASDTEGLRYSQSSDGGSTWAPDILLSEDNILDVKSVDIVVENSRAHVVYGASLVVGSPTAPVASGQISRPYLRTCTTSCTTLSSWSDEALINSFDVQNPPADAPIVHSSTMAEGDDLLVFFHGTLPENTNFEQVLGHCIIGGENLGKEFKLPTTFERRMVKPQIAYNDGFMYIVYEQVIGQSVNDVQLQEVHYAQLDVSCHDMHLPIIAVN
ncbi:MAG: hypothetical protein AAGD96_25635 [Chloroflexota bacterium]